MFDPTVFENLKIAFENQLYDLDTLDRKIDIINRVDRLELAVMSREFSLQFKLAERSEVSAEIQLTASLKELAAEILELEGESPASTLRLRFYMEINNVDEQCRQIEQVMQRIWEPDQTPTQTISYLFGSDTPIYSNVIELSFNRKISEEQMDDLPDLIKHMLQTLTKLGELLPEQ
ncbi:hypothetical protein BK133_17460 [Paenibacillus sp. FSL H8-0548]|uniref:hypothetical protein n=1 Tax=Paenibacillus sp. FSL H8-0548 TaxID=1920422 RepID=UPI00096EE2E6|nr:hypothetical protein [Paenibacillus sp. FSL H8-0548]OMF29785.1 hypothetical protein BK133_17460 [Paenibacillus sp. FSL H8-0548]